MIYHLGYEDLDLDWLVSSILWNTHQESPSIQLMPSLEYLCPSPKREIKVTDKRQNSG